MNMGEHEKDPADTGINSRVLDQIIRLAKRHNLRQVLLFGSRARGDFKKVSDIDLAVSGGDISGFALAVDEETDTLLEFDVVNLDGRIQEELIAEIRRDGRVLYEKA